MAYYVTPELWTQLKEHIKDKTSDDFVFTKHGKHLTQQLLSRNWNKAVEAARVKHISLVHASRHSTASEIWRKRINEARYEIQNQLGHDNTQTQRNYIVED
jgi:integrase